jgi:hypothetical protein
MLFRLLLLYFILLSILVQKSLTYYNNGYEIRDLEDGTFVGDTEKWYISNNKTQKWYNCSSNLMLGGYDNLKTGEYVEVVYSSLQTHQYMYLSFTFWRIDSIDWNYDYDFLRVEIDNAAYTFDIYIPTETGYSATDICGGSSADAADARYIIKIPHAGSSVKLRFISYLWEPPTNEAIGISKINILFKKSDEGEVQGKFASGHRLDNSYKRSTCPPTYNDDTCPVCHESCAECQGPSANDCLSCNKYYFFDGKSCLPCMHVCDTCYNDYSCTKYLCPNPLNEFAYWNHTCHTECKAPLIQRDLLGRKYCHYPCNTTQYLYWNGSCINHCVAPLKIRDEPGAKFCDYICAANEYLYWNGSCLSTCPTPYSIRKEGGFNFCDYPCTDSEYLYWNGSCISTCDTPFTPLTTSDSKKYCLHACTNTNDYLYWDSSCNNTCAPPLISEIINGKKYCKFPCGSDYLYWTGECRSSCSFPLSSSIFGGKNFCHYPCPDDKYLYWDQSCQSNCTFPLKYLKRDGKNFCEYICPSGQYLYWNGDCESSCSYPLDIVSDRGKDFCAFPCNTTQVLYWDKTCLTTCDPPFKSVTKYSRLFCESPCTGTDYLYPNGTCAATCQPPFHPNVTKSKNVCEYPCLTTEFLASWSGECLPSCDLPLLSRYEDNGDGYCDFPCTSALEYLFKNGSCLTSCNSPFIIRTDPTDSSKKYCDYPCLSSEYLNWDNTCISSCQSPYRVKVIDGDKYCDYPCSEDKYYDEDKRECVEVCEVKKFPETGKIGC